MYPKAKTEQEQIQADREARRLMKRTHEMESQDIDTLFELLRKNIRGWWD